MKKILAICTTCRKKHKSATEGVENWTTSPEEQMQECQKLTRYELGLLTALPEGLFMYSVQNKYCV